jgi:hypothetical protein
MMKFAFFFIPLILCTPSSQHGSTPSSLDLKSFPRLRSIYCNPINCFANPLLSSRFSAFSKLAISSKDRTHPSLTISTYPPRRKIEQSHHRYNRQAHVPVMGHSNDNNANDSPNPLPEGLAKLVTWLSESTDAKTMNLRLIELGDSVFEKQESKPHTSVALVRVPGCTSIVEVAVEIHEPELNPSIKVVGWADARIARCVFTASAEL